ncbi:hypothetical protein roselon_02621 [Roseibacterium elongatum DSM 19469]|uniref:DUF3307 domain-containing protein n=1 Tax=Roseicyclus elongatus DSM 19469 TaxID=1294273 RepID=W8SR08_9RHOB|nr:DUF3307 domain-containing protein [Roseibacterium elongatum]AHM04935.1 hypothetical protein roselon_02621 [Roseibacterium elongatum DSM 19469]
MAAHTFAALFLAHVIADYLAQTRWLVDNKRRPIALGTHIALVFLAMVLTTLTFSPWFLALTAAHLLIDILKTFGMPSGLPSYIADQLFHIASIVAVAVLAPGLWSLSPLSSVPALPQAYLIAGAVIFAARGGQYAVLTLLGGTEPPAREGVVTGWVERVGLCLAILMGLPLLVPAIMALKLIYVWRHWAQRSRQGRRRLVLGSVVSFTWAFGTALGLALLVPSALPG